MTRHPHFILVLMIMTAATALGAVTSDWKFPVVILLVLFCHMFFGLHLQSKPDLLRKVALGIPFAIWFRLLSHNGVHEGFTHMVQVDVLFMVGFYALAYGTYHVLCVPRSPDTRGLFRSEGELQTIAGPELAGIAQRSANYRAEAMGGAIVAIALAGVLPKSLIVAESPLARVLNVLLILFVGLVFIELRRTHRLLFARNKPVHLIRQAFAFTVLMGFSVCVQDVFVSRVPQLGRELSKRLINTPNTGSVSFHRQTELGSVTFSTNDTRSNEVVVTLWSDTPYPYLRGAVHDIYQNQRWNAIQENNTARRVDERDGRTVFSFRNQPNDAYVGTIYTAPEYKGMMFLPLGTFRVSAFADKVIYSDAFTAVVPDANSAGGYGFYEPGVAKIDVVPQSNVDDNFTREDLQIPDELRAPLKQIALSIMDPNETPGKNAIALTRYFENNFKYATSIELRGDKDPILQFLQDIKAAHCEYFASATTLLLRSMGIPARYVTGYVALENGLNNTCFIARRKDAHAWAEMYTKEGGWKTVETTPAGGVPQPLVRTGWDKFNDYANAMWERVVRVLQFGGIRAVLSNLWSVLAFVAEAVPLWGWIGIALIGFVWSQRDRIGKIAKKNKQLALSKQARALQKELAAAERALARHGVRRDPSTPVGRFIAQVRVAAEVPETVRAKTLATMERYLANRFRESGA